MNVRKRNIRTKRALEMSSILESLYPDAKIELNFSNEFECLVAVILSAQCTDLRVNIVTEKLFKKYRTLNDYCSASQKEMEQDVFSCGFYRNKAKNIISAAKKVQADFSGALPQTMEELLTIPGVARKTANVILSVIFGKQLGIAVDTHVRRFAIRFDLSDYTDPIRIEKDLMEILPLSSWWGFNHRLVHYGRHVCKANKHDCSLHPLTSVYPQANSLWPKAH